MPESHQYLPARLVKAVDRWYIVYYQTNPGTGKLERFRETHNLNRISDRKLRMEMAKRIIKNLNSKLPLGWPFFDTDENHSKTNIIDAIELAKKIKCTTDRQRTIDMVESMTRIFFEFLKRQGWKEMSIGEFQKKQALEFLDYAVFDRGIGARTYNNYIERMRALFMELKEREYILYNPFSGLKKKKEAGKRRRAFNADERMIVADYISKKDKWLMLGVLLQYHCFIRPIEQRRIKIRMIRLNEGVIWLPGSITKNREEATLTIPDVLMPFLRDFGLEKFNQNYLLFGKGVRPHNSQSCGHNTMNYRHRTILEKMKKQDILSDIEGLSYYSWKDTDAIELFKRKVNILEIMRQLRHKDLSTTQKYCQSLYTINHEIKALDNALID